MTSIPTGAVTVHTFGVHYRWELPPIIETQLRLAHEAREEFVALHLAYDADVKALWSSYPAVASAETELEHAETDYAAVTEQAKALRVERSSRRTDPEMQAQLRAAKNRLSEARQTRRDAITAVRDVSAQRRRDRLKQLRADQKALYTKYTGRGLYWATVNDIAAQHKALVQRVNKQRREGRPAQLRHRRFDGTGTLTVQIQRRDAAPIRTPATLANAQGRYSYFAVVPWIAPQRWEAMVPAERRSAGRVSVRMRVGSTVEGQPQWVDIPVQAHRWLPARADITHVRLSVKRIAARRTAQVLVTARTDQQHALASGRAAVAVHLGWRQTESGIQVASWRSTAPLQIPSALESVMIADPGATTGHIVVPPTITARLDRTDQLGSIRAQSVQQVRDALAAWLHAHGPVQNQGRAPHRR